MTPREHREAKLSYLKRIAVALETIAAEIKPPKPKIVGLIINFGKQGATMGSVNTFSDPDVDAVPYTIEAVDANGAAVPLNTGDVVALTSTDGNSLITPNPNDATGASGKLSANKGFSGAVSGTATYTPAGATQPTLSGTWSGTFTPGAPASLAVVFGAGA